MSTHDLLIADDTFPNVRADVNAALPALASQQSGTADPPVTYSYQRQARTDLGVVKRRNASNGGWVLDGTLAEIFSIARSSNTVLGSADYQCWFTATGTFTQTLTAAATLGDGWWAGYRNDGAGVITIDPNASEQIDGATTISLNPGESCIIECTGSAFKTYGRSLPVATQAQQEAAAINSAAVTPAVQQFHPSAAKAWCLGSTAGTVAAGFNMTSVTDSTIGQCVMVVATDFSSANWCSIGQALVAAGGTAASTYITHTSAQLAGSVTLTVVNANDWQPTDPTQYNFIGFGDQS